MADPRFPDVPITAGVPSILRAKFAAAGSFVASQANIAIGTAQGIVNGITSAIGDGFYAANGIISNVQASISGEVTTLVNGDYGQLPVAMTSDSTEIANLATSTVGQWGIYDQNNQLVLEYDSFKELEFKQNWKIANYPMELGAFQSYNKVQTPFIVKVAFTKGGSDIDRTIFLNTLETISNSIELYNVVTPERVYTNVSIENYDYQRRATQGVKLLTANISLLEIRLTQESQFSNTRSPTGANVKNGGIVQTKAPTQNEQAAVSLVQ